MKRVDIGEWKEFRVGELFETSKTASGLQVPTGGMISKTQLQPGATPRITVSGINNGVMGYFADTDNKNYRVYENFISVSFLGTVFYQKGRASIDMKVHCLKPLGIILNENIAGFLIPVIRQAISKFMYADQLSSSVLPELTIKLPATPEGTPDWAYMDEYMSKVMQESQENLVKLRKAIGGADGRLI